jgi:hypothetical protein
MLRTLWWLAPAIGGGVALWLGQDANWDLRNYHFYGPHAWLHDRLDLDVAVAHVATYYNPTLHLPFYWAVLGLEPRLVGFVLGALAGCNVWLGYAIAWRLDAARGGAGRAAVAMSLALAGVCGALFISEIGTSFGDNVLSLLVLAAVALALRAHASLRDEPGGWRHAILPGLLCGAAAGLKLPFAIYGVALAAALLALPRRNRDRVPLLLACGAGGLAGALLTGGWWAREMWLRFGNPVFPYFNEWFGSPWASAASYRDPRFLPAGAIETLAFPFHFALTPSQVAEVAFRDLRFPLLYVAILALFAACAWQAGRGWQRGGGAAQRVTDSVTMLPTPAGIDPAPGRFLLVFVVVAFVVWMRMFGIARYLVPLEVLAPLALWCVLQRLVPQRAGPALAMLLLGVLAATVQPADWQRRAWSDDYFDVRAPRVESPARTLVLMAGHEPSAYMIPFMPAGLRFLRVQGYFTGPGGEANATDRLMRERIAAHTGPIQVLYRSYEDGRAIPALAAQGLLIDDASCRAILPGIEPDQRHPFLLCGTTRLAAVRE